MNSFTKKAESKIDLDSFNKIITFLELLGKPYTVHAGFGLHLRGFSSELDDIDIKIFHDDLEEIYILAKNVFGNLVTMKDGESGCFGSYIYRRIEIDLKTPIDICCRTGAVTNLGKIEFPYSSDIFNSAEYFKFNNKNVLVSSLESIFLYYLVLRRGSNDNKNDHQKIQEILNSEKFNEKNFLNLIWKHPKEAEIINLYKNYLNSNKFQ